MTREALRPAEPTPIGPQTFRIPVEIASLPFVFTGNMPSEPASIHWKLSLPNPDPDRSPIVGADLLARKPSTPYDGDIHIAYITSDTDKLTEKGYRNARGLGSFLLDNLLTYADINKFETTLTRVWTGRGLSPGKLLEFYEKRGFVGHFDFMVRAPQPPIRNTEIARILG